MNDVKETNFYDLEKDALLTISGGTPAIIPYGGALLGGCLLGYTIGYVSA